jgi:hypothetical protein
MVCITNLGRLVFIRNRFFRITISLSLQELHFLTQFISAGLKIDERLTLGNLFLA